MRTLDSPFPADLHDAEAVRREWGRWIAQQFKAATGSARMCEWAQCSEALPAELQSLAEEHPTKQAELAAGVFENEAFIRGLLGEDGV
ncbi:hypothetical protein [Mycobacterium sp. URHB0021]